MGWENSHLHEFLVDRQRYGVADPTYDEPLIGTTITHSDHIVSSPVLRLKGNLQRCL
jgi:hypothetical protein